MAATTRRKSAEERREEILAIAIEHFAASGFRGTSTAVIAREAGISQPYLFRLFRTKKELFLAAGERACQQVLETFRRAASGAPPGEKLAAMGRAYSEELLPDRHAVLMMMQGFAAAGADPDIRAHVRQTFRDMATEVAELGGVAAGDVWAFFANGMLLNIVTALELEDMAVLAHAHPVSACGEQHGAHTGRRAELDEDVLSRV
ncbi:MAG TPA: TetR/AcrR family transcriptional regulator [Gemmatimonadaceae bacterium]|nr:TetR/AcrR family transcriptional regulator [Gemmatimonadaceae bacterium]